MKKTKNRWLIAAAAVGVHISIGAVYAYSVFKKPLHDELGWEPTQTAWAFSIAILFLGLSAAFLGPVVERMGPRKSGMLSAVLYSSGLAVAGLGVVWQNLFVFYLGYGAISGIGLSIGYICPVTVLVKWFPDKRGLATGLATMGFGFGALLASSLIQLFITNVGLAPSFFILSGIYLVVMMVSSQYLAPPPEDWKPAGFEGKVASKKKASADLADLDAKEALGTARFYYLWLMFFINITCGIAVISVASPLSQEIAGLTPAAAATMVGLMGLFNGLGRISWSTFSDWIGRPMTFVAFFVIQFIAFLVLPKTTNALFFQLVVFLILSCYGGGFATVAAFIGDVFGTKGFSAIYGYILTAWAAAGLVGPLVAAKVREATGSYEQTLQLFAGLFVIAIVCSILIQLNIAKIRNSKIETETAMDAVT